MNPLATEKLVHQTAINVELYTTADDEEMTLEQLEAKYGKLTWNQEHQDFTDGDGFVRATVTQ
jgi:hypothetical protein